MEVYELTDGGQTADEVAAPRRRLHRARRSARSTSRSTTFGFRARPATRSPARCATRAGAGCAVRLLYNVDSGRPPAIHPPPSTRPELLAELPIDARPVPGVPDLMHHKYVVRDRRGRLGPARRTGRSTRGPGRRTSSWRSTRRSLAAGLRRELRRALGASGRREERPRRAGADRVDGGATARAWFTPGHGTELSHAIANAIGCARRRVRIASPVITSAPILGTLAELGANGPARRRRRGRRAADRHRLRPVGDRRLGLEDPAAGEGAVAASVLGQALDAVGPRHRPRLHARQGHGRRRHRVRRLVQPLALGGDERRERARDPRPGAGRPDGGVHRRDPRRAIPPTTVPERAMATISSVVVGDPASSRSSGRDPPGASS